MDTISHFSNILLNYYLVPPMITNIVELPIYHQYKSTLSSLCSHFVLLSISFPLCNFRQCGVNAVVYTVPFPFNISLAPYIYTGCSPPRFSVNHFSEQILRALFVSLSDLCSLSFLDRGLQVMTLYFRSIFHIETISISHFPNPFPKLPIYTVFHGSHRIFQFSNRFCTVAFRRRVDNG